MLCSNRTLPGGEETLGIFLQSFFGLGISMSVPLTWMNFHSRLTRLHYIYLHQVCCCCCCCCCCVQNPLLHFCTKQNWYFTMPPGSPTLQPCPPEDPGCSNYLSLLSVWSQLPQFEAPYHLNIFCATKGCRIGRQQNRTEMYRGYFKRLTFALMCDEHHSPQSHYLGSIICSQFISWWVSCFHTIADKHCISLQKPLGLGLKWTSAESFWQWSPQPLHHLNHPVFLKSPGTSKSLDWSPQDLPLNIWKPRHLLALCKSAKGFGSEALNLGKSLGG